MTQHFIFGYGSLINGDSRAKTGQSGEAIPVRVRGIERAFSLVVPQARLTAVGATLVEEATCNGVIVPVPENELPKFDAREVPFEYQRTEVGRELVWSPTQSLPEGTIWAYVTGQPSRPTREQPIVQSYVDVILTGCFGIGEDFAREFILNTRGWHAPWLNDRKAPRYLRAMPHVPLAEKIDGLLWKFVPTAIYQRREDLSGEF